MIVSLSYSRPNVSASCYLGHALVRRLKMSSGKFKPKFSGDRAMLALQRQLADDPGLIPEPSFKAAPVIRPLLIRLCSVAALAAFVA